MKTSPAAPPSSPSSPPSLASASTQVGSAPASPARIPQPRTPLPDSWQAEWITAAPRPDSERAATPHAAPLLRREWDLPEPAVRATLHLSGLGTVLAWINGGLADEQRLAPGLADHSLTARAVSWDVTSRLVGLTRVALALELGRGFFDLHTPEVWQWSTAPWRDAPRATAQLHVTCADGSEHVLVTDGEWRSGTGGLLFDSLYEGETWDEAAEPHGWREPGFDDADWPGVRVLAPDPGPSSALPRPRAAREIPTSGLPLREAMSEPILVQEHLRPRWTRLADGRFVGDVGRVIAGWTRLEPLTDQRRELTIVHGERLAGDGSVVAENEFIPTGRFQRDEVALEGRPFESHHTYKGFRYIEVRGARPGEDVEVLAQAVWADVPVLGGARSSDPTLDWLDRAFVRTVQANLHWVLTDTPTFEKNGWTGDAQVALPALLTRFDLRRFLTSWLDDFLDAQRPDGSLPVIVPSAGWGYGEGQCAPAPEWTTLYPVLVDALEGEYGLDLWPIHGAAVERYLDAELGRLDADGLAVGILGDYLSPGAEGPPPEDIRLESSILLRHALDVIARAGRSDHCARYAAARDALGERVLAVFFDAERSCFASRALGGSRGGDATSADATSTVDSAAAASSADTAAADATAPSAPDPGFRQAPQVLALDAGIVPAEHESAVLEHLSADIDARGGHHDVGALAMARLCGLLVRAGRGEVALEIARNPTGPSWESWRRAGHGTLLEMWTGPVRSRAHYFMGASVDFLARDLVGLRRTGPDWQRFSLAPTIVPGIERIEARHRGIRAGWSQSAGGDAPSLFLLVPDGAIADVTLPDGRLAEVGPGEHHWLL